jgi:peptide/nickel transport system substrate-binding protein
MMVSPKAAQAAGANFGTRRCVPARSSSSNASRRTASCSSATPTTGTRPRSTSTRSSTRRSPTPRCAWPTCVGPVRLHRACRVQRHGKRAKDKRFKTARITEIGYQGITINIGKSEQAQKNPLGRDARVREAFELSLDRQGLAQVVMDNEAMVGNQWVAPSNAFYAKSLPVPKRNVERARALLKEAGVTNPSFTLLTATTSDAQRLALVVQAMSRDAGFDVKIQTAEFATSLNMADKGDFDAYILAWSGRPTRTATSTASMAASSR